LALVAEAAAVQRVLEVKVMTPCFLPSLQLVVDLAAAQLALLPLEMAAPEVQAGAVEGLLLPVQQPVLLVPVILHQLHPAKVITVALVYLIQAVAALVAVGHLLLAQMGKLRPLVLVVMAVLVQPLLYPVLQLLMLVAAAVVMLTVPVVSAVTVAAEMVEVFLLLQRLELLLLAAVVVAVAVMLKLRQTMALLVVQVS